MFKPHCCKLYLATLLATLALTAVPYRLGIVMGGSMSPSLSDGSIYLLDRHASARSHLRRGDVIVFRRSGLTYLKRVVALAGDSIFLLKHANTPWDQLVMDWQLPVLTRLTRRLPWRNTMRLVHRRVPPGCCYVVGDDLERSLDSRHFGPVALSAIDGRVVGIRSARPEMQHLAVVLRRIDQS